MDMKRLLEAMNKFAGEPEQRAGDQVRGTEKAKPTKSGESHPFKGRLVGAAESQEPNMLKGLKQVVENKSLEWELAEAYAKFLEDNLGVEPKRPSRKGSRPSRDMGKTGEPSKRYRTVKEAAGDGDVANAVVAEVIKLIGEGHTEVSPDVITTKVSAALGRPFMLKDLVAANNSSPELQHYIASINPSKIKFSTDILTVKNEDPMKEKQAAQDGVSKMANRAASRPRLGESIINEETRDIEWQGWGIRYQTKPQIAGQPLRWMVWNKARNKDAKKTGLDDYHEGIANSPEEAIESAKLWIQSGGNAKEINTSKNLTIDFNARFVSDILNGGKEFFAKIEAGPVLIISDNMLPGFNRTYLGRSKKDQQLQLPSMTLSGAQAKAAGLRANGRYVIGDTRKRKDGALLFPLIYQSTVQSSSDKIHMTKPGLTVAAPREASGLEETDQGISKSAETKFHKELDTLVHKTFGRRKEEMKENAEELNIGDDVIITGPVEFKGSTGVIDSFGRDKRFVVVNLYNHGRHSFHSSDVSFNEYADSDEEQDEWHIRYDDEEGDWNLHEGTPNDRLKLLWDKYAKNLPAARGDSLDVSEMEKSARIVDGIRKFTLKHYGPEGLANLDTYAEKRMWDADLYEGVTSPEIKQAYRDIFKTEPHSAERRVAVEKYQQLRKDAMMMKKSVKEDEYNDDYEDDYEEEDQGFFVAISSEEDGVFIGMLVKEDGKWRERTYKGNAPYNWGGTYMGYLTPQDVMSWINKDYGRSYEVQGPMDEDEANEYLDYMSEGWESGPEERQPRERDPDWEYDQRRQQKADDAEMAKPKKTTYKLLGRGPNYEPNYDFGLGEFDTQEEAIAARKRLMADPDTPNPRDIGIQTIRRSVAENRIKGIKKQYNELKEMIEKIKESRGHKIIARKLADIERNPGVPAADNDLKAREERAKAEYAKYVAKMKKKNPNYVPLYKMDEAGSAIGGGAIGSTAKGGAIGGTAKGGAIGGGAIGQQSAAALNTFKAATGANASAPNIANALDKVTQGQPVGGAEMKVLEPVMKDIATVATDPKLANQFKSLAGQINQTQKAQQQQK